MSQISPPIRILVVLAIAVMGVYMLFMRPKVEVVPAAEPAPNAQTSEPAVSGPGKVAESADDAVQAANDQLAQQESVDGADAGETAAGNAGSGNGAGAATPSDDDKAAAAAAVKEDLKGLPKPVKKALRKNKVLVLLFWNGKSADDKAVHAALKKVDRWNGRVSVQSASIKKIAKYGRIARGVDVEQSPTIVITDPEMHAETLVGYVDATTIDQTVVDAFRNTTGLFKDAYLRKVNGVCTRYSNAFATIPNSHGDAATMREIAGAFAMGNTRFLRFATNFKAVKAPKKWRAFKKATVADHALYGAWLSDLTAFVGPNPGFSRLLAGLARVDPKLKGFDKRYNKRMDAEHLTLCGSQR